MSTMKGPGTATPTRKPGEGHRAAITVEDVNYERPWDGYSDKETRSRPSGSYYGRVCELLEVRGIVPGRTSDSGPR